jgi:hypothetical protein
MTAAAETARTAVYVYGIVAREAVEQVAAEFPGDLQTIPSGPVAAVAGTVDPERPLGLAADLRRHDAIVKEFVDRGITILPMRFGAVVGEPSVLVDDVLEPNAEALRHGLDELAGLVQYTVKIGYVREAVLSAILRDDPEVAAARKVARDPNRGTQAAQIRLGQQVVAAIGRRRGGDAERVRSELEPVSQRLNCELAEDPDRVADCACLVRRDDTERFERAVEAIAEKYGGALTVKLLGPLAPYDFVPEL